MNQTPDIDELILVWEDALAEGRELSAADICKDHPALTSEVERRIRALKAMRWMNEPVEETPPDSPTDEHDSRSLGRYQLTDRLGEGGYGQVWKAYDPHLDRHVAVKVLRAEKTTPSQVQAFLAEGQRVAKLRCPGIVPVFDVGQQDGQWFIVSELIEGTTLEKRLADGHLPPEEAARIAAKVAAALDHAHRSGFIHRDIKPSNIIIDQNGTPYLTDFGIATVSGDDAPTTVGTLAYMAPEQLGEKPTTPSPGSDIYSLGVVLYQMLTGRLPHSSEKESENENENDSPAALRRRIVEEPVTPPQQFAPSIPAGLAAVCMKCLGKSPADRFASASDLADALMAKAQRRQTIFWLSAGILVVLLAGGLAFTRPWDRPNVPAGNSSAPAPAVEMRPIPTEGSAVESVEGTLATLETSGTAVDALKLIDLERDIVQGHERFRFDGSALLISPEAIGDSILLVPYELPDAYTVTVVAEHLASRDQLWIGLHIGGQRFQVKVGPTTAGIDILDRKRAWENDSTYHRQIFDGEKPVTIRCTVTPTSVFVTCDGRTVIDWNGDPARISTLGTWERTPDKRSLMIGAGKARYRVTKLEVQSIEEKRPASTEEP